MSGQYIGRYRALKVGSFRSAIEDLLEEEPRSGGYYMLLWGTHILLDQQYFCDLGIADDTEVTLVWRCPGADDTDLPILPEEKP